MDMLNQLRNLNTDRQEIDDLVALSAFGTQMKTTYETSGLITPEWLTDSLNALRKEIANRRIEQLDRERKLIRAQKRTLLSREEKRAELDAREAEIEKLLGATVNAAGVAGP